MSLFAAFSADEGNKAIDYAGFAKLTREFNGVRQSRRISEEKFFEHSGQAEVVILDLRGETGDRREVFIGRTLVAGRGRAGGTSLLRLG